jgi:hypothetical protein
MNAAFQRPTKPEGAIPTLNAAMEVTNLAKKVSCIAPAKTVFGSVKILLTLIRYVSSYSVAICSRFTNN